MREELDRPRRPPTGGARGFFWGPRSGYGGGPRSSSTGGPRPTCAGGPRPKIRARQGVRALATVGVRAPVPLGVRALPALGVRARGPRPTGGPRSGYGGGPRSSSAGGPRPACAGGPRPMQDCCRGSRRTPADKLSVGSTGWLGWSLPPSGTVSSPGPPGCGSRCPRMWLTLPSEGHRRRMRSAHKTALPAGGCHPLSVRRLPTGGA
jgi:translation initiation factor IF-2